MRLQSAARRTRSAECVEMTNRILGNLFDKNGELTEESKEAFRIDVYKHIQMFFGEIGGYNGY